MTARLILQGGAKPFRVTAPGGNASSFVDLLFDGDWHTLRILLTGQVSVPDTVANALYSDWTVCNQASVPLGKTFSSPPLATIENLDFVRLDTGQPQYQSAFFSWHQTNLHNGPTFSEVGMGLAISVNTLFIWNGYRTLTSGSAHTASYAVFDTPMGE